MINCKSHAELEKMRRSGQILRQVHEVVRAAVKPGATTMDLEHVAEDKIREMGAKPAFKGYYDYPCVLCTSVNNEIIHGIPSEKLLCRNTLRQTASAWCAILWDTVSAPGCMKIRKCRILAFAAMEPDCVRVWCWPLSRWSTWVNQARECWTTSGRP